MTSKQNNAHSELPWKMQCLRHLPGDPIIIYDANSGVVTDVEGLAEKDAAFIVTACNQHYENKELISELVEVLRIARVHVGMAAEEYTDESERIFDDIKQIDAALSKAKEQS